MRSPILSKKSIASRVSTQVDGSDADRSADIVFWVAENRTGGDSTEGSAEDFRLECAISTRNAVITHFPSGKR